jgi:hypothetical protein
VPGYGQLLTALNSLTAVIAKGLRLPRLTAKGTIGYHFDLRQQRGQGPGCGGLGRAPLATDQHPANFGADSIQDKSHLHFLLADDGCEGENGWHIHSGSLGIAL